MPFDGWEALTPTLSPEWMLPFLLGLFLGGVGTALLVGFGVRLSRARRSAEADLLGLLGPIETLLQNQREELRHLESRRMSESGRIGEQLRSLAEQTQKMERVFASPNLRGRWGELTLRRSVELAGLARHCDFSEQPTVGDGRARPDLVVHLPGDRQIAVDAKAPLGGYAEALDAARREDRQAALTRYAAGVRRHIDQLAAREYPALLGDALELTVLYLPNDSFFAAAAEGDPQLIEYALQKRIAIATPMTLFTLLFAVARGWSESQVASRAKEIHSVAEELHGRLANFVGHLERVGSAVRKSVEHYNAAVGSYTTRLVPQVDRLRDLGDTNRPSPRGLDPIDARPRETTGPGEPPPPTPNA